MLGVFQRLSVGVLAIFGEDSLLRGTVPCRINMEHGVQMMGMDAQKDDPVVITRSIATIAKSHNPKVRDTISHPDGEFRLDSIHQDNGVNIRFIALRF